MEFKIIETKLPQGGKRTEYVPKSVWLQREKVADDIEGVKFSVLRNFITKNREQLFKNPKKSYQISFLLDEGWRAPRKTFLGSEEPIYYNVEYQYANEKQNYNDNVYSVSIIET